MDTRAVAEALGTNPRVLRQFLRSPQSTFKAVGSNQRYDFKPEDMPMMKKRFDAWAVGKSNTAPEASLKSVVTVPTPAPRITPSPVNRDKAVWDEEGDVVLPDIRIPAVRRAVRMAEAARVRRLDERLLAAGLHITQWRERVG